MSSVVVPELSHKARAVVTTGERSAGTARIAIRVATYNICGGRRWPQVLADLRAHPADLVCLQEVLPGDTRRTDGPTAPRIAAALGGSWRYAPLWQERTTPVGNMTLCRGRLGAAAILKTDTPEPYGIVTPVEIDGAHVLVANLHLSPMRGLPLLTFWPSELRRWREIRDLDRRFAGHHGPLIVAGDFNTFYGAPAYRAATRRLRDCRRQVVGRFAATRPTYCLPFVIDHILVSRQFEVETYQVAVTDGSDHNLVTTTLGLPMP